MIQAVSLEGRSQAETVPAVSGGASAGAFGRLTVTASNTERDETRPRARPKNPP